MVVPAYNAEKTIKKTIKSVLKQTFTNFQLSIINDGSTDSTLDIINSFSDKRIQVFSFSNAGANVSRNRGIAKAQGEYISFLDADDLWTPDKLELQLKALQENPQAKVAYSWTNWIDGDDNVYRRGSYISATGNVFKQLLLVDFIENGSNPLIVTSAIKKVGNFDESLILFQDWEMWLRLAFYYNFTVVPKPQILYRSDPKSFSKSMKVEQRELAFQKVKDKMLILAPEIDTNFQRVLIANRYKCLVVDCLERANTKANIFTAFRFLLIAFVNDPLLLTQNLFIKF